MIQRLQALAAAYSPQGPATPYYNFSSYPFPYPGAIQINPAVVPQVNSYTLQPPPKKIPPSPLAVRHQIPSPKVQRQPSSPNDEERSTRSTSVDSDSQFIKPLSQVGTLTTTDSEGRVRVIVPVPSGAEDAGELLRAIRLRDDEIPRPIQRTVSEKVPNRSELMSQVQRTAWARHTTK